jgi:quinol-cytochrome oxidoreductase complex cytochrome b subunit
MLSLSSSIVSIKNGFKVYVMIVHIENNVLIPVVLNELFFYPTPNNFNYFYCVGFLLGLLLSFQLLTGILVACYYIPKVGIAFTSVDYLIRDIVVG